MTISVALATFNGASYLEPQLASIAAQTRLPDEIVVGDDRSTDETLAVIERFAACCSIPVRCRRNDRRLGSTGNFESLIGQCQGEVIAFADQDDVWSADRLARIEAALDADRDASYVFSDGNLIDEGDHPVTGTLFRAVGFGPAEQRRFRDGGALDVLVRRNVVTGATLAVRRSQVLPILPIEPGWVHDYYLVLVLAVLGHGLLLDQPLIEYRVHGSQQIGVSRSTLQTLVAVARRQTALHCREEADSFQGLRVRLVALNVPADHPALRALDEKARFWRARADLRERPMTAPSFLLRRRGDYGRYSLGWKQAAVDLVAAFLATR